MQHVRSGKKAQASTPELVALAQPCDLWGFNDDGAALRVRRGHAGEVFSRGRADDVSTELIEMATERHLWVRNGCVATGSAPATVVAQPAKTASTAVEAAAPAHAPPGAIRTECTGFLSISAVPGAFSVLIDGNIAGDGPVAKRAVACGEHRVRIRHEDGRAQESVVTVGDKESVMKIYDFDRDVWRR